MKKTKYVLLVILCTACVALITLLGIYFFAPDTFKGSRDNAVTADIIPEQGESDGEILPEPIPEPEPVEITLMAVGDNLMHMGLINSGIQEDGTYNYSALFTNILDDIAAADISVINQETILGGNQLGFSGYPTFNSPTEVGDAIAEAGFNVVLHASNHTADKGLDGIISCANFWKEKHPDVTVIGIYSEKQEETQIPIMEIEGVKFALLNYTYGPNMASFPTNYEGYMNILCKYDPSSRMFDFTSMRDEVITDIQKAEELADVVIVFPHWGTEYQTSPSTYQEQFAMQMTEAGADLIIGTHPHVIEPVEWITSENGNRALCYYSLGNYASTQKDPICMLEGMAHVTFVVDENEQVVIDEERTGVYPMVCQYTNNVRFSNVYFLDEYTEELALQHGIYTYGQKALHLADLQTWSEEVFGTWALPHSTSASDFASDTSTE